MDAATQQFAVRFMTLVLEVERRQGTPAGSIQACGEELLRQGVEIMRIRTSIPTLHPEVSGLEVVWFRGEQARSSDVTDGANMRREDELSRSPPGPRS